MMCYLHCGPKNHHLLIIAITLCTVNQFFIGIQYKKFAIEVLAFTLVKYLEWIIIWILQKQFCETNLESNNSIDYLNI